MRSNMRGGLTALPTKFSATFPNACREGTAAKYAGLGPLAFFSCFHVLAQDGVHRRLVAAPMLGKERRHVGINAQGNLLLRPPPDRCIPVEVRAYVCGARKIDIL